jgi:hypothetical protein
MCIDSIKYEKRVIGILEPLNIDKSSTLTTASNEKVSQ